MTPNPITLHHGDSVSKIRKVFQENNIHHIPVVSGSELIGMISWSDFLRVSFGDAFRQSDKAVDVTLDHTFTIEDVMTRDVFTIDSTDTIRAAADALSTSDFHALPIVSGKELVGIVTTKDLLKYLLQLY